MISKQTFIKVIKLIQQQEEIDNKVGKSLETVCDGYVMFNSINEKYRALSLILKEIFKDDNDWIDWWLYEDVDKKIWEKDEKGKEIETLVDTPSKLYNFLIKNIKEKDKKTSQFK